MSVFDRARPAGHVVVIDDDASVQEVEKRLLEREGWGVSLAASGAEALELLSRESPDLILCDIGLPDMHGFDLIRQLKAAPDTAAIPIVVVSGLVTEADVVAGLDAGAHEYLFKPFRPMEFRARCAAALRMSRAERELRMLAENASDIVARMTLDGTIRYMSPSSHALLGFLPEDMIGRRSAEFCHPDDVPANVAMERAAVGELVMSTRRVRRADGAYIWVETTAQIVRGAASDELEIYSSARDITARREATDALEASEVRYRQAFEHAPVGMAEVSVEGQYLRVNKALCDMFRYPEADLLGMRVADLAPPEDRENVAGAIARMAGGADVDRHYERRYVRSDGKLLWTAVSAAAVLRSDGSVDHMLAHYVDIGPLKEMEQQLRHLADHDALTGLLNRRGFDAALDQHVAHAERYGNGGALVMFDLDGFKAVNDTFGHRAGDRVIAMTAGLLGRRLRSTDGLARLGGDEFAAILLRVDPTRAAAVVRELIDAIRTTPTQMDDGTPVYVTTSVGIAMFSAELRAPEMMVRADEALYAAKDAGRDGYAVWSATSIPA